MINGGVAARSYACFCLGCFYYRTACARVMKIHGDAEKVQHIMCYVDRAIGLFWLTMRLTVDRFQKLPDCLIYVMHHRRI